MKSIKSFFFMLAFILLVELIQTQDNPGGTELPSDKATGGTDIDEISDISIESLIESKPSKAFTVVLMVYLGLIVIGSILVLILIKPKLN